MISWNQEMGHFYSQAEFLSTLGLFVPDCKWDHTRKIFRMYDLVLGNIKVKNHGRYIVYKANHFTNVLAKDLLKGRKWTYFLGLCFVQTGDFFELYKVTLKKLTLFKIKGK